MKKIIFTLISVLIIAGCSEDSNPCSSADSINDPKCQKDIPDVDTRPVSLNINFINSFFYDHITREWKEIKKENLTGGIIGIALPINSETLNAPLKTVMSSVLLSNSQNENPGLTTESNYNSVPFIEIEAEESVTYSVRYKKYNQNNVIVEEITTKAILQDGRAILPIVNEAFNGRLFPPDAGNEKYTHSIEISAESKDKKGTKSEVIYFDADLYLPNKEFYVDLDGKGRGEGIAMNPTDLSKMNLRNRWESFETQDTVPNSDFYLLSLREKGEHTAQVQHDLRIAFKETPKVTIEQEIFVEIPFSVEELKSGKAELKRGYTYLQEKSITTATTRVGAELTGDFELNLFFNGSKVNVASGNVLHITDIPQNTRWDLDFKINMAGKTGSERQPLKPLCQQDSGSSFSPISSLNDRVQKGALGFYSVCHPKENKAVFIPTSELNTSPISQEDSWFDFFSYIPPNMNDNVGGHFYGIKSMTFKVEGCVSVEFKPSSSTDAWENKIGDGHARCEQPGYAYYTATKTFTIQDHLSELTGVSGLEGLIQNMNRTSSIVNSPSFMFNGNKGASAKKRLY